MTKACFSCGDPHASLSNYQVVSPHQNNSGDVDRLCAPCAKDFRRGGFFVRFIEKVKAATGEVPA